MFVYKVVNKVNGMFYVGLSENPKKRFEAHKKKCYDKRYKNSKLYLAMKEFGPRNFYYEIVEETQDPNRESYWIKELNATVDGYNTIINGKPINKDDTKESKSKLLHLKDLDEVTTNWIKSLYLDGHGVRYIKNKTNVSERTILKVVGGIKRGRAKTSPRIVILKIDESGNVVDRFLGLKDAMNSCDFGKYGIMKVLRGERNRAGGYYWKYKD